MLKPAKMRELKAIVPLDKRKEVVEELHKVGEVQIESVSEDLTKDLDLDEVKTPEELGELSSLTMDIERIMDVFDEIPEPELSTSEKMKEFWGTIFSPDTSEREKMEVEVENKEDAIEYGEEIIDRIGSKVRELDEELEETNNKIDDLKELIENLEIIQDFGFDTLSVFETSSYLYSAIGKISKEKVNDLIKNLKDKTDEEIILETNDLNEEETVVGVWSLQEYEENIEELLNFHGFSKFKLPKSEKSPSEKLNVLKKDLKEETEKREELYQELENLQEKHESKLLGAKEVLNIEKERADVVSNFSKTKTVSIIQGWVPEDSKEEVKDAVNQASENTSYLKFESSKEVEKEPPTLLKNPPIIKRFEFLTRLFGMPSSKEIDPTLLMAFTYVLFFGLMLTDVAYGAITLVIGVALYKGGKLPIVNIGGKDFATVLILGSIATIITGIFTGSYFGDFVTRVGPEAVAIYNPIENPLPLLLFSILIGLIHEYSGVLIGLWESVNEKEWKTVIGDRISWLLLIPGAVILIMSFLNGANLSSLILYFGAGLVGIGILMLIYAQGPMGIMDIFDMLGNILSYTRILALALVTSALAITFNEISFMLSGVSISGATVFGVPIAGLIIGALVFIGTQLFSWGINLIGSFVHALRLHYVEFFAKFFEGTGKRFKPFRLVRRHTEVK